MAFFVPLRRSVYRPWALGLDDDFEARGLASALIRKHFATSALYHAHDNDRDGRHW